MDRRQRIAQQRVLAEEALGKLRGISQLFGTEDRAVSGDGITELTAWGDRVEEFEKWVWGESPIA